MEARAVTTTNTARWSARSRDTTNTDPADERGRRRAAAPPITNQQSLADEMRQLLAVFIVTLVTLSSGRGAAMEVSRVSCESGDVLKLRGDIKPGDFVKFRAHLGDQRRIAGLDLDSPGGSLHEGVRIAMLTRQKRLSTFVAKECDSACAFIFLLGRKRYVSAEAKIGVHAVGNDFDSEDNGTLRDTIYFARLSAKLGIPSSITGKMVTTPPGKITFLDQSDLSALKVIVRDPFSRADESNPACRSEPVEETAANTRIKASNKPESRSGTRAGFTRPADRSKAVARAP
jgi:hypothetical protein